MTLAVVARAEAPIGPPLPASWLGPFCTKPTDADGIPASSSSALPDAAVFAAAKIVRQMLEARPDLALVKDRQRGVVMVEHKRTLDRPNSATGRSRRVTTRGSPFAGETL